MVGLAIGYFLSLGSSLKKSVESVAALPLAVDAMDDFSDEDMAYLIRMIRGGIKNKNMHEDKAVLRHLAKYYQQRSSLPEAQQEALGARVLIRSINELAASNPSIKDAIKQQAEQGSAHQPTTR